MLLQRGTVCGCREASNVLEDTLKSNVDVGVDDDRDEENSNTPSVGKAISQVKSIAPDPAPVATDVTIGVLCETDSTYNRQSALSDFRESIDRRETRIPVIMPGIHADMQIKTCHFISTLAIESFLTTDNRTTIAIMRILKSMAWAFDWLNQPLTRHTVSGIANGLGVWPFVRKTAPEMVLPRPYIKSVGCQRKSTV